MISRIHSFVLEASCQKTEIAEENLNKMPNNIGAIVDHINALTPLSLVMEARSRGSRIVLS